MRDIRSFDIAPENYSCNHLERIPDSVITHSEMSPVERRFINGMIRLLRPRRILELGVAEGAGSAVILNAISDMPEATLMSFDTLHMLWNDPSKEVGFAARMMYPDRNAQWSLYTGADFSQYADSFDEPFDMVIIDTAHLHPVESLNFLSVLPYLSENAVVLFHDLALYTLQTDQFSSFPNVCFANKLAYDTIVGEKLKPVDEAYLASQNGFSGLGAIQISSDTRKYIRNIFDMLFFPWPSYVYHVSPFIKPVATIIKKHYEKELYDLFCQAVMVNAMFAVGKYEYGGYGEETLEIYHQLKQARKVILYGAGNSCSHMLGLFERTKLSRPEEIWAVSSTNKKSVDGIPVRLPAWSELKEDHKDTIFVITVGNEEISKEVKEAFLSACADVQIYELKEARRSVVLAECRSLFDL